VFKHIVFTDFDAQSFQFRFEVAASSRPCLVYKLAIISKEITVWTAAKIEDFNSCSQKLLASPYFLNVLIRSSMNLSSLSLTAGISARFPLSDPTPYSLDWISITSGGSIL